MVSSLLPGAILLSVLVNITMQRLIISLAIALGLLAPAIAFAQTSTTGLLTVYVQVLQNSAFGQTYSPGQVTVSVSGQSPSLTSFPGSQSGTAVVLNPGSYNVTAGTLPGYAPSYSTGCSNTIAANQTQLCVVTMTPSYAYNQYPTPYTYNYPYGYYVQPLTCQTLTPNVAVNQQASFRAVGGAGGTYNWATNWQNYPNAGQTVNASFPASGVQTITVTNAAQTATCSVNVTNALSPVSYPYYYPQYNQYPTTQYPTYYPNVTGPTYYPQTYPQLPRTGFGPHDTSFAWAIAAVLMIAAGIMTAPYARKAFAVVSR